jgi:hypothetical protein
MYFVVPLATFAKDSDDMCEIFVEYQYSASNGWAYESAITFGTLFYQSAVYQEYIDSSSGLKTVNLWVNENAISGTALDALEREEGPNAFYVEPQAVPTRYVPDAPASQPTFIATLNGISSSFINPYFYMDMTNPNTIVWTTDCMNTIDSPNTACTEAPLLMQDGYANITDSIRSFTDLPFSGYSVSGNVYPDNICFGARCTEINVYAGNQVSGDENLYGQDGAYGVLGFGLSSPLWLSFINPETNQATYAISLARQT